MVAQPAMSGRALRAMWHYDVVVFSIFAGMKYLFVLSLMLVACGEAKKESVPVKDFPVPGTVVASAEMPVEEEQLNKYIFSVKVIADSAVASGVYDVDADFGPNLAVGQFTLPKGMEQVKPEIRKGKEKYSYIIGFRMPGDTTFNEYFEVTCEKKQTKMKYVKAYSLE